LRSEAERDAPSLQAFEAQRLKYLESENAELLRQVELMANDAAEAGRKEYRYVR